MTRDDPPVEGVSRAEEYRHLSGTRGLVLGLGLGDTAGRWPAQPDGVLRCSVTVQLAAFVVEGTIRGVLRAHRRGIGGLVGPVWHAYCRWAAVQGIDAPAVLAHWRDSQPGWPYGWLVEVAAMRQRRGSAPATVAALQAGVRFGGTVDEPVTNSAGAHAVTSVLATAAAGAIYRIADWYDQARQVAALTHGAPDGYEAAACAAVVAAGALQAGDVAAAVASGLRAAGRSPAAATVVRAVGAAGDAAATGPRHRPTLDTLAADQSATAALAGAVYTALSFPDPAEVVAALSFAASAAHAPEVAAVTGALLGAAHGAESLPVDLVSRLEVGWVLDTLARDLVTELLHHPSGDEDTQADDPRWWQRYPGG